MKEIPNVYTIIDMIVISVSSFLLGISIFYLLTVKPETDTRPDVTKNMTLSESSMGSLIISNTGSITEKQSETDSDVTKIENVLNIFKGNEQRIIKELYHNSELTQAELAARADIPKSTLSRILGDLEKRGLIIRYENGMSKMVKLADSFQK
ncbi:MAG: MarR family transcriptional regulator [Candidatus Methanoperedens sp.]|nr:MarR family transcriptional regulator [Candidatus Methanoperedens sp.]